MKDENIVALLHGEKHLDKIQNTFLIKTPHQIRYRAIHLNTSKATLTQQRKLESLVSMIWNILTGLELSRAIRQEKEENQSTKEDVSHSGVMIAGNLHSKVITSSK